MSRKNVNPERPFPTARRSAAVSSATTRGDGMARAGGGKARTIALVGPNGSGKTTLMEALLFTAGAVDRQGTIEAGTTVGDATPEARARHQSVELNVASFDYMGDRFALIDCPGSVE